MAGNNRVLFNKFIGAYSLKIDTGANRRSDDMAQLCLSTILRVGSNNIARRFRSSLTMLVEPERGRPFRNSRRGSDQWGKGSSNLEAVIGSVSHELTFRAPVL